MNSRSYIVNIILFCFIYIILDQISSDKILAIGFALFWAINGKK